ncbi:N-acetylmuramoyl-L-alanine amidase [Acidaminobacter hydrogenoformans]|uniref:N-acetylmuramoyl-L-alanine amidase n=1 Tax=Acidaminobacter hydrogenoformans DSM 2784 TaxID=1120920 RepID=A0A1G5S546_9FIRM|nr:N-acetylmuramoyl-L-alanine amidase [Acidaminobacter hydrogenoformans]SCZ81453.1 N-acetylmuramoyl-L-alanine amidase [Acidaminobacter hydrogenoformans DSM 2784]
MKKFRAIWVLMIIMLMVIAQPTLAGEARPDFNIEVDGKVQSYEAKTVTIEVKDKEIEIGDMPAIILEGRTLVPIKEVFQSEGIGADVAWNHEKKEVTVTYDGNTIVVAINSPVAYVNGKKIQIDPDNEKVVPKLIRDTKKEYAKTMIPLRFVSEALGYEVAWDPVTYTAAIITPEAAPAPEPEPEPVPKPVPKPVPTPTPTPTPVPTPVPTPDPEPEPEVSELPDNNSDIEDEINTNNDFLLETDGSVPSLPTALKRNPILWTDGNPDNAITLKMPEAKVKFEAIKGETVRIQSLKYEAAEGVLKFIITASGPISDVAVDTMEKKLVMDVINAENGLSQVTYKDNPVAAGYRTSQFSQDPMTTRIVLDLKSNNERCDVSLSEDRRSLIVEFEPKSIHTIELGQSHLGDFIRIAGMSPTSIKTFRMSDPNRIVIDLVGTRTTIGWKEATAEGQFVSGIRTDQFNATTTRVVAVMDGLANYEVYQSGAETWVQFTAPDLKNLEYNGSKTNPIIRFNKRSLGFESADVEVIDDYQSMTYTFVLPEDVSASFGKGELVIDDYAIDKIELKQDSQGRTNIVIKQLEYYEYRLNVTSKGIMIAGFKPKALYDKIVVIDAGHGGTDPGAVSGGYQEKAINLAMSTYVKALFDNSEDFKVYYTRTSDVNKSLKYRTDLANTLEADIFVSIHNNAMSTPAFEGMETLYMPGGSTEKLSSISIAKIFHETLLPIVDVADRGLKPRDGLYVIRHTKMPAIILELGFMTNPGDLAKITNPEVQERVARGIYTATEAVFNRFPTER